MPTVQRLTATLVKATQAPAQGYVIAWETELRGFGLKTTANGTKTYIAQRRVKGRTVRVTLGQHPVLTVAEARTRAFEALAELSRGIDPAAQKQADSAKQVALGEAFDDYMKARTLKPLSKRNYRDVLQHGFSDWSSRPWTSITRAMVATRHQQITIDRGPTFANHAMCVLQAVLNFCLASYRAVDDTPLLAENPVSILTHTRAWNPERKRTRHLKTHELAPWFAAVAELPNRVVAAYLIFLLLTGCRRTEAAELKWADVDLRDRTFHLPDPKSGKPVTFPLSDYLHVMFTELKETATSEYVFPSPATKTGHVTVVVRSVKRITRATGIEFSPHDLRRSFATVAESMDVSFITLKRLLNHSISSAGVTGDYIQLHIDRLRKAAQRIESFILQQGNLLPSNVVPLAPSEPIEAQSL